MRKTIVLVGVAAGVLMGCATEPDKLTTQYVSPVQYQRLDCDQVGQEMVRVSRRINDLYVGLKKTADDDSAQMGVGLVLFWPALFFLEGGDGPQAAEYARMKGEYGALESVAVKKKCTVPKSARIIRWAVLAQKTARGQCNTDPGLPELISATDGREDYKVPCGADAPNLVRCESGKCRAMQ